MTSAFSCLTLLIQTKSILIDFRTPLQKLFLKTINNIKSETISFLKGINENKIGFLL